jgi:helicase associated protein
MKRYSAFLDELKDKTFEKRFSEITAFLEKHKEFPTKKENKLLYHWMSHLRSQKKRNLLKKDYEKRLDSIGLPWNKVQHNWHQNFNRVKDLLEKKIYPTHESDRKSYRWIQTNLKSYFQKRLDTEKIGKIEELLSLLQKMNVELIKIKSGPL